MLKDNRSMGVIAWTCYHVELEDGDTTHLAGWMYEFVEEAARLEWTPTLQEVSDTIEALEKEWGCKVVQTAEELLRPSSDSSEIPEMTFSL